MAKKVKKSKVDAVKSAAKSEIKDLRGRVKKLEATVGKLETKADRWKAEAKSAQKKVKDLARGKGAAKASAPAAETAAKAETATAAKVAGKQSPIAPDDAPAKPVKAAPPAAEAPLAEPLKGVGATTSSQTPDETWTVTRLRAAAKDAGVAGYSRKSKADLIATLR